MDEMAYEALEALLSEGTCVKRRESMSRHTTLRVGGPADCYVEPAHEEDLSRLVRYCTGHAIPWMMVGRGSNLLVRDGGIRGVVISLSQPAFSILERWESTLRCGAGVRLKDVAHEARRQGLAGLEFLEGIPGNLGGALRMNAGAMGRSLFDVALEVRSMDAQGNIESVPAPSLGATYRSCAALRGRIALGAVLRGQPESPEAIADRMKTYNAKRWETQPAAPSAGCMFKNPAAIPAGRLVDELGLKGQRSGDAMISDVHGNFIVNKGRATAQDVLTLMQQVQELARTRRGIALETEVQVVGEVEPETAPLQAS